MFKDLNYIDYKPHKYIYQLIDTEFECELQFTPITIESNIVASSIGSPLLLGIIIPEYKKREYNHKQILNNIFKFNLNICDQIGISDIYFPLRIQHDSLDKYFTNIYFNKKYYNDLNEIYNKYSLLI